MSEEFWVKLRMIGWFMTFIWFLIYEIEFWLSLPMNLHQLYVLRGILGMFGTLLVMVGFYRLRQYDHNNEKKTKE